jgi:hypothetical protein
MSVRWRSGRKVAALVAIAGLAPAVAWAATGDKWQIHLTPAGQAAARAVVLKRGDLAGSGWTGGSTKPDTSDTEACPTFHPKQSDLVLNGAADSKWQRAGVELESQANVLQTAKMVRLDWQRTVVAPQVLPCLRVGLKKELAPSTLVSFRSIDFPKVATYSHAYRGLVDVKSGVHTIRVLIDIVVFGRGKTEIVLSAAAPAEAASAVRATEIQLARLLASRAH